MALMKKKKEESTNDKIVRLFQEGKSVEDIIGEVALPNTTIVGVIQRRLGPDAVADAVVQHEKNPAAEVIAAANVTAEAPAAAAEPSSEELEGMSKLERYMFEKKRKLENASAEQAAAAHIDEKPEPVFKPEPAPAIPEPEIPAPPVTEPEPVPQPEPEPAPEPEPVASLTEPEPKEEVHKVSLLDDYLKAAENKSVPSSTSEMEGISLTGEPVAPAATVPSYTIPSPGEEYAEMDALVPPDVESAEISDAPILVYDPSAEPAAVEEEAPAVEAAAETVETESDKASRAADKMKAFAMSQIEANNSKIAELESKTSAIAGDFQAKIDDANNALTLSQCNFDMIESKLTDAYNATEQAREEHRIAIAAADDEYRRKLEAIEEEYRAATFEANNKFQEFDDNNRQVLEQLENDKQTALNDLSAKRTAVAELHSGIESEKEKLEAQIRSLKEENEGYKAFLG